MDWCYVPTELNPADLPSRGCLPHELKDHKFWQCGPKFINQFEFGKKEFEMSLHQIPHREDIERKKKKFGPELKNESTFQTQVEDTNPTCEVPVLRNFLSKHTSLGKYWAGWRSLRKNIYFYTYIINTLIVLLTHCLL